MMKSSSFHSWIYAAERVLFWPLFAILALGSVDVTMAMIAGAPIGDRWIAPLMLFVVKTIATPLFVDSPKTLSIVYMCLWILTIHGILERSLSYMRISPRG